MEHKTRFEKALHAVPEGVQPIETKTFPRLSAFVLAALLAMMTLGLSPAFAIASTQSASLLQTPDMTDADFYAVLYPEGTLTFQAAMPESTSAAAVYAGSLAGYKKAAQVPWLEQADKVLKVEFAEDFASLKPQLLTCWFDGLANARTIDLTNLDASQCTRMEKMFMGCTSLVQIIGLDRFDTSSSTYFGSMFRDCASLKSLDLSHFDSSHVEVICFMFNGCTSLEALDLSSWADPCLELTVDVFSGCDNLTMVKLGSEFSFRGSGDLKTFWLPDGDWKSSADGKVYTHKEIPNNIAATYTRIREGQGEGEEPQTEPSAEREDGTTVGNNVTPKAQGPSESLATGATVKVSGCIYKVTNDKKATIAFLKAPKRKGKVTIPAAVTINGRRYAVTGIARKAFSGTSAKTIIVKTKKLVKKNVKGCFKGASKIKIVKVPSAKKRAYKTAFAKSNSGKAVKVI